MRIPLLGKFEMYSVIHASFNLLKKGDQKKIKIIILAQTLLGFLDLAGIALIGLIASLTFSGINSKDPSGAVGRVVELLNLSSISFQAQTAILSTFALCVFVSKTLLSLFFIRKSLTFIARCAAEISSDLYCKILSRSLVSIGRYSSQQYVYSITSGIENLILRIIGSCITLVTDFSSLLLVVSVLLYVNLPLTIVASVIFTLIVWFLHQSTANRSKLLGNRITTVDVASRESVIDSLSAYREVVSKARINFYQANFRSARAGIARDMADSTFLPYVGKYVIESSIFVVAFILAGAQFLLTDSAGAIATLSIFVAAGTRLAPAILRLQQGLLIINNSWGIATSTMGLIKDLGEFAGPAKLPIPKFTDTHEGFVSKLVLEGINFQYPLAKAPTLKNISIEINPGESVAIVGPSGSGKTTLVDLMIGLIIPNSGKMSISGINPIQSTVKWPGAIGYVPQEVYVANSTVSENVALGFHKEEVVESKIWGALEQAQIASFISTLDQGLATSLGDRGIKLSGGQRQRLGIARALLTKPKILFLDEATSALDSQTEHDVSEAINKLKGQVTLIFIAHRLSTAKKADRVIYLSKGEILAEGSFEEVKRVVPDFQHQAELMDLG